jgi:hypothetical protein
MPKPNAVGFPSNTITPGPRLIDGSDLIAILSGGVNFTNLSLAGPVYNAVPSVLAASAAITPGLPATYMITVAGVGAFTLAAPTAGVMDGTVIQLVSTTANAHTLTATGLLRTGTASVNVATFAAQAGAGLTLVAYQGAYYVTASVGITFS